jgi:hypothetical protein
LLKVEPLKSVLRITKEVIARSLDGLPAVKMYSSNLGVCAFKVAVEDYTGRR